MRLLIAVPLLLVAACSVEGDGRNEALRVDIDENAIEGTADEVGNAVEEAAAQVGNAAEEAGATIENEVRGIDVDVDVNRNKSD